jgi:hypothetical protein
MCREGAGTCLDHRSWLTQPASVGFYGWARRLDDRVAVPLNQKIAQPWMGSFMARVGISTAIIFGGGFLGGSSSRIASPLRAGH